MPQLAKDLSFLELFILNTIIYFDIFDYPLTLSEIYSNLYTGGMVGAKYSLNEIKKELAQSLKLQKIITTQSGFYFLSGRQEIIDQRLSKYVLADPKFKIAKKIVRVLKYLPFIKLVTVCNSLALFNAKETSDIDLFIVTGKDRIWLTRFLVVMVQIVFRLRPPLDKEKARDKICLSFFTAQDNLDFSKIRILEDDLHFAYWLSQHYPLYERDDFYNKFVTANSWIKKYLPNHQKLIVSYRYRVKDHKFNKLVYRFKEKLMQGFLGNRLNSLAKKIQLKKMSQTKKDIAAREENWIIFNDQMLKFHENDRRLFYLEKFEAKRKEIIDKL